MNEQQDCPQTVSDGCIGSIVFIKVSTCYRTAVDLFAIYFNSQSVSPINFELLANVLISDISAIGVLESESRE